MYYILKPTHIPNPSCPTAASSHRRPPASTLAGLAPVAHAACRLAPLVAHAPRARAPAKQKPLKDLKGDDTTRDNYMCFFAFCNLIKF